MAPNSDDADADHEDLEAELQVREVFAYFGRAMYAVNCVEQSLTIALMQAELKSQTVGRARRTRNVPNRETWEKMFDQYMDKHDGLMLGNLIARFRRVVKINPRLDDLLNDVLAQRNNLAHAFFRQKAVDFAHSAGRHQMLAELEASHELFNRAAGAVEAAVAHVIPKLGIDPGKHRAEAEEIAQSLLAQARAKAASE